MSLTPSDREQMEAILQSESFGHLAMTHDGELYVVPINHTYRDGQILVHCALEGKKLAMIRGNPRVCYEVSRQDGPPVEHAGEACDHGFESVICWGTARCVDDLAERHSMLLQFQARYGTASQPRTELAMARAEKCGAVAITVTRMTGRRRAGKDTVSWEWEA